MTEEERKAAEDKARKDADTAIGEKLDKMLSHQDALNKRMDAIEARGDGMSEDDRAKKDAEEAEAKKTAEDKARKDADEREERERGDPEKLAADKKRKDEEDAKAKKDAEEKGEKEREDKAKKDAEEKDRADKAMADSLHPIQQRIADIEKTLPRVLSDTDRASFSDAQARADRIYQAFGDSAPRPMQGEDVLAYRQRMVKDLKKHSPALKDANIYGVTDPIAFGAIEAQVFADAEAFSRSPARVPRGQLIARKRTNDSGHTIIEYDGDPSAWMNDFRLPLRGVEAFKS